MNGLRFIRIRCNFSLNELADILSVTRQAISSWENEKKEIPPQRLTQLSDFFGVEEKYFKEISDNQIEELLCRPMYRWDINNKETYRYISETDSAENEKEARYFWAEREISFDEEFNLVQKNKVKTLKRIADLIDEKDFLYRIDAIRIINRNCEIYEKLNCLLENSKAFKYTIKVAYIHEFTNVLNAMLLAYNLLDENGLQPKYGEKLTEDYEWTVSLSGVIKKRWKNKLAEKERELLEVKKSREVSNIPNE